MEPPSPLGAAAPACPWAGARLPGGKNNKKGKIKFYKRLPRGRGGGCRVGRGSPRVLPERRERLRARMLRGAAGGPPKLGVGLGGSRGRAGLGRGRKTPRGREVVVNGAPLRHWDKSIDRCINK